MARPTRFENHRWLGDKRVMIVHDLDNPGDPCAIDDLLASEKFLAFGPDLLAEARNRCFKPCRHCVREPEFQ
jgi:hypothetical protein